MAVFYSLHKNQLNENYRLEQDNKTGDTTITNLDRRKKIVVHANIGQISRGWYKWYHEKELIQDAFPFLSADEREFIKTGLTKENWDMIFGAEVKEEK